MSLSRPLTAPKLSATLAMLSLAATCCVTGPPMAFGASRQTAPDHHEARQARCVKARHPRNTGIVRSSYARAASKRMCRSTRARHAEPAAQPAPPASPTPTAAAGSGFGAVPAVPESSGSPGQEQESSPPTGGGTPFRFFSPESFWNTLLADDAPLDANSAELAGNFDSEVEGALQAGNGPWINTTDYSVPIYTVPTDQPNVRVQLVSQFSAPALQSAWNEVPLPPDAHPAGGSDGVLVVWQPSTDRLWEFWRLRDAANGWQAAWGGAVQKVSSNTGAYGPEAWPGAKPWWGSSASSLSIAGGLITLEDLQRGQIDHALALAIPNVRAGVYASPAQRTDGVSSSALSLPEGAHLRLDPELDLSQLRLPPLTLMIAQAAQRYGIVIRDRARTMHFFAQDPVSMPNNPYAGPTGYFEGKSPAQLLAPFPWSHLQLLSMELHRTP